MKTLFFGVTVKKEPCYEKVLNLIENIKESNIAICYSNQFVNVAKAIKNKISKNITNFLQILGCSNPKFSKETEAILVIGQGKFHTVSIAYESGLPTYVLENDKIWQVSKDNVEKMKKRDMGMMLKYLNSEKVGILVTTKPGQERLEKAIRYKRNLKDKKSYIFIANQIDTSQFENFGLDCFVNTACPRMDLNDGNIINLSKVDNLKSIS
jgi:diphthamide biosynthesis enzyme Dph1/Dph2-like protein